MNDYQTSCFQAQTLLSNEVLSTIQIGLQNKIIMVTGGNGMLGHEFARILAGIPCTPIILTRENLDLTDKESVLGYASIRPDIIIHCAAKVDAELCEIEKERCRKAIVDTTINIAKLARITNAHLLYPQSFLIFDGSSEIDEGTLPNPLCRYGEFKREAENIVLSELTHAVSVRMGGFFGGYERDKNFVGKFACHLAKLDGKQRQTVEVGGRVWQPTYTKDLALNSLLLLALKKSGIYNMAALNEASFFDIGVELVGRLGISDRYNIVKVMAEKFNRLERARRPQRALILNKRMDAEGLNLQRNWRDSIGEYLEHPYFRGLFV